MEASTPKQRMLNAYRGKLSDRTPVAPEFWYLFPARILGVNMVEFEREIPFWKSLQTVFRCYGTEGWGIIAPKEIHPDMKRDVKLEKIKETAYRETVTLQYHGDNYESTRIYDQLEPSWMEKHLAEDLQDLDECIKMITSPEILYDFNEMNRAYHEVGEDYLLEVWLGTPFFDFVAELTGFEKAVHLFITEDPVRLAGYRDQLITFRKNMIREVCARTPYESFMLGCSYSCNSLIGPALWREWDKPYIQAITDEIHSQGKLIHMHFHGRCMETVSDFADIGLDCVCPFERSPGGDVDGVEGLRKVKQMLKNKVTMNGNIHTVETLIRGTPADVRREVSEIKEAFEGSARFIIGTGDQVGRETPLENIYAMIDEAKKR